MIALILFTLGIVAAVFLLVPPAEGLGNLVRIIYFHVPTAWLSVIAFFFDDMSFRATNSRLERRGLDLYACCSRQ